MSSVTITRHEDEQSGEYHAHVEGADAIGRLTWVKRGNARVAEHTLVPPAIGGRGVAADLVEHMVADARERGFTIDPVCSYVADKFAKNPDWSDVRA